MGLNWYDSAVWSARVVGHLQKPKRSSITHCVSCSASINFNDIRKPVDVYSEGDSVVASRCSHEEDLQFSAVVA